METELQQNISSFITIVNDFEHASLIKLKLFKQMMDDGADHSLWALPSNNSAKWLNRPVCLYVASGHLKITNGASQHAELKGASWNQQNHKAELSSVDGERKTLNV